MASVKQAEQNTAETIEANMITKTPTTEPVQSSDSPDYGLRQTSEKHYKLEPVQSAITPGNKGDSSLSASAIDTTGSGSQNTAATNKDGAGSAIADESPSN